MMTPLDIQNKNYSNAPLGYKKTEVDAFMADVLKDYEQLYRASSDSKEKINSLSKMVESYKGLEDTMKNTLVVAQQSAEQLTKAAKTEAESIVAEATQKSQEIINKATARIDELNAEYERLKKEINSFILHSRAEFEVQIKNLDTAKANIE